ncbi:MAG: SMP-30/gluconolactonase/LRE family protein [Bacteroidetes bacterium]|nr:SMP-30/gluconolactonase/LRE family protein [Bacteroidota bacterium]MBS1932121.1 SMP-30/gluconolactonase/LRE family protein [Bacteroidota bacterium]
MKFKITVIFFILFKTCFCVNAQQTGSSSLFVSSALTPVNSFTNGVEGPAVDKEGNLYAVNYDHQGTIGKITPSGAASIFVELPKGSIGNGIRFSRHGDMYVADYTNHNILKVDMNTKTVSVFAYDGSMAQPNDIAITNRNTFFASNPDWANNTGSIWYANKKGKIVLLEGNMGTTNGIEVSPDNKRLYVNESVQRKVWVYDISKKGKISSKKLFMEFPDFGLDGMRCDANGNLYVTRYDKGVVAIVSPQGKLIREVTLIGKKPSNVAFGGPDGKTVYVTMQDKGNVETFRTDTPGQEWVNKHKH